MTFTYGPESSIDTPPVPNGATAVSARQGVEFASDDPDDISIDTIVGFVRRACRLAVTLALLAGVIALVATLIQPRKYVSVATFVPAVRKSQAPGGLAGLAEQLGVGIAGSDATQNPAFYIDLIKSRAIVEQLVDSGYQTLEGRRTTYADLEHIRGDVPPLRREAAITRLTRALETDLAPRTGVVTVRVKTNDAAVSQQLVARTLDLLGFFNQQTRRSQAAAERRFTEGRLAESRAELRHAEDRLTTFLSQNVGFDNSPSLRAEEARLQRELATRQGVVATLAQAYEQARIDEVRDTPLLTVIQAPERAVKPESRGVLVNTVAALVAGALCGLLVTALRGMVQLRPTARRVDAPRTAGQ